MLGKSKQPPRAVFAPEFHRNRHWGSCQAHGRRLQLTKMRLVCLEMQLIITHTGVKYSHIKVYLYLYSTRISRQCFGPSLCDGKAAPWPRRKTPSGPHAVAASRSAARFASRSAFLSCGPHLVCKGCEMILCTYRHAGTPICDMCILYVYGCDSK